MPTGACQLNTRRCSEKRATREKGQVDPLHAAATELTEGRIRREQFIHGQAFVDPQAVQCRGLDPGVRAWPSAEHLLQATQQVHAVGHGQWVICWGKVTITRAKPEHCRVERVAADPAIQVLAATPSQTPAALTVSHHGQ